MVAGLACPLVSPRLSPGRLGPPKEQPKEENQVAALVWKRMHTGVELQGSNLAGLASNADYRQWLLDKLNIQGLDDLLGKAYYSKEAHEMEEFTGGLNPPIPSGVLWKPIRDVMSTPQLFVLGAGEATKINFSDINQGNLGNCWLLAALSAAARYNNTSSWFTDPDPLKVTMTLYKCDGSYSSFRTPFSQTVSTELVVNVDGTMAYTYSDDPGEYWPAMAEKAVAAAQRKSGQNGYEALVGGVTQIGLAMILGGHPSTIHWGDDKPSAEALCTLWSKLMGSGVTVCVTWQPDASVAGRGPNGEPLGAGGLVSGHAYVVLAVVESGSERLAMFRNPWGSGVAGCASASSQPGEWTGKWSDCDDNSWSRHPAVKEACKFGGIRNDGNFWMSFDDIVPHVGDRYGIFVPEDPKLRAVDLASPIDLPALSPGTTATPSGPAAATGDTASSSESRGAGGRSGSDAPSGTGTPPADTSSGDASQVHPGLSGTMNKGHGWNGANDAGAQAREALRGNCTIA